MRARARLLLPKMQILRCIQRPLRRPGARQAAISLASMHHLSSPSAPLLVFTVPARWCLQALARRVSPLMAVPNQPLGSFSRFAHGPRNLVTLSQVKSDESGKKYRRLSIFSAIVNIIPQRNGHSSITESITNIETDNSKGTKIIETGNSKESKNIERSITTLDFIDKDARSDKNASRITRDDVDGKRDAWNQNVNLTGCKEDRRSTSKDEMAENIVSEDEEVSDDEGYTVNNVLARSKHHDGSIYRGMDLWWKKEYRVADRNETRLEAMMLSDPTDCNIRGGIRTHYAVQMLQIFSLELAEICVDGGLVELYGYIAVRDDLDPLLNYIVKFSRDNPIFVEQGSLINMVGPKRGIQLIAPILIEYDMRVKADEEENDLQLIDGASIISDFGSCNRPYNFRIPGDCGTIKLTFARVLDAVEATVEVFISEVQSSFNLSLDCFTSGMDKKISLFDGAITDSCSLKRSVIAVKRESLIDLKFEMGALSSTSGQYRSCFRAKKHGHDIGNIKTHFALVSVKVTWSTLPNYFPM